MRKHLVGGAFASSIILIQIMHPTENISAPSSHIGMVL